MLPQTRPKLSLAVDAAKKVLISAGVFSFFVNILMLTGPLYMLQIYDRVLSSRSHETLFVITALITGLFAAMAILDLARSALLSRAGSAFERELQPLTFDLSMDASRAAGVLADQPLKDLRQVRQFLGSQGLIAVFDAPWAPLYLLIVFMMHWLLGVVAVLGLIVLVTLAFVNERSSREANMQALGMTAMADRLATASMRNAAAVDAMGMRARLRERWVSVAQLSENSATTASDRIGGLTAISKASRMFLQSLILGVGAFLAIRGEVTAGVMIAASIITGRALAPIEIVTGQWRSFASALTSYRRLRSFVGHASPAPEKTPLPAPMGALAVDGIYCQPGGAKIPVLKAVSFELAAGDVLGVIGPSAAGKSTLARAIVGVERLVAGEVRLDGADILQWDRNALGEHIGFLPQEVELFGGTAAQNIGRLQEEMDADKIIAAAQAAGAHQMILGFADGYDTEIGERGCHISAGQRQRLALARALYDDPALVVLDEPNSNLDSEGEAALTTAIKSLKERGATVVIITHRPAALAHADKLLLLANGEVRGFGPRDDMMEQLKPKAVASLGGAADQTQNSESDNRGPRNAEGGRT